MKKAISIIIAAWAVLLLLEFVYQRYRLDIIRITIDWPVWLRAWIWGWY